MWQVGLRISDRIALLVAVNFLTNSRPFIQFVELELEKFSQSYSKASSLSYAAGVADFDSVNNFSKDEAEEARNSNSNLSQTKEAIQEAMTSLDRLVTLLQKGAK